MMTESRAVTQNIRPLRVPHPQSDAQRGDPADADALQLRPCGWTWICCASTIGSRKTPQAHLENFYHDFEQVRGNNYDGT